ncbi:hypothetical protein [Treponema endosymbiont of Eucomonympha sp.]|uniref:hypothetical protein n=1 Tax=Treponema endosymbiont of Eucomonympha sp. TaxID=1580831 RepID=UPI000750DF45|nr:hypothetical protein [Treponema endosymbiont of Eucomonympha sp.]
MAFYLYVPQKFARYALPIRFTYKKTSVPNSVKELPQALIAGVLLAVYQPDGFWQQPRLA